MSAIDSILHKIQTSPDAPSTHVLRDLMIALDTGAPFDCRRLYGGLDYKDFSLALDAMRAWRLEERRVASGRLSAAVTAPETCWTTWVKLREQDFGLMGI